MGRFSSTAERYEQYRQSYPPEFFRAVAERLNLSDQHALIDLGTGPGLLALGFAPYVGHVAGVDPEPKMIAAAREAARRAGQTLRLIEGRAEDLPRDIGRFDVVTIGRALHWMNSDALGPLFDRLVADGGAIVVCAAYSARDGRNPWLEPYNEARRAWSDPKLWTESLKGERVYRDLPSALGGRAFFISETINVETTCTR
jgi:ubiquinone/menaquinone biosynthesis C-methylase UbiE